MDCCPCYADEFCSGKHLDLMGTSIDPQRDFFAGIESKGKPRPIVAASMNDRATSWFPLIDSSFCPHVQVHDTACSLLLVLKFSLKWINTWSTSTGTQDLHIILTQLLHIIIVNPDWSLLFSLFNMPVLHWNPPAFAPAAGGNAASTDWIPCMHGHQCHCRHCSHPLFCGIWSDDRICMPCHSQSLLQ